MIVVAFDSSVDHRRGLARLHDDRVLTAADHAAATARVIHP